MQQILEFVSALGQGSSAIWMEKTDTVCPSSVLGLLKAFTSNTFQYQQNQRNEEFVTSARPPSQGGATTATVKERMLGGSTELR
jgi:hypothetical protein